MNTDRIDVLIIDDDPGDVYPIRERLSDAKDLLPDWVDPLRSCV